MKIFAKHYLEENKKGDIEKLITIFKENGYEISAQDAYIVWKEYSSRLGSYWIELYDKKIFNEFMLKRIIKEHCQITDDN